MKRVIGRRRSKMAPALDVKKEDSRLEAFMQMERVFSVAASIDAIRIFYAAKEGIESSSQAIKELGLTQKRYYTHLKRLLEAGLIEKVNGGYQHTTLGKISYKLVEVFSNALSHRDRLDLVDRVFKAKDLSVEETEEIMHAILKDSNIVPGERIADILGPVRVADTWEKVVYDTTEYLEKAEESIYFATQYFDAKTVEAAVNAAQRGVRLNCLVGSEENFSLAHQALGIMLGNPRLLKFFVDFVRSPKLRLRHVELPYTFVVIDGKYAMVEVPQPHTRAFCLAFFFHSEKLCGRLIHNFEVLYDKGRDVAVIGDDIKEKFKSLIPKKRN